MSAPLVARLSVVLLLAATALPVAFTTAWAQDAQTIDRINRLERDLQTLQRQVYRGGTPPASAPSSGGGSLTDTSSDGSSAANRLNSRIDELENQIRQMTGRFEEVEFASSQANRRIDKLVEDVDFRLNQLERGGQPPAGQPQQGSVEQVKPTAQQQGVPAPGTPVARGSTSATPGQAPSREGVLGSVPVDAQGRPLPATNNAQQQNQQTARATAPASGRGKLPAGTPQERYNYAYKLLVQSDYADAESAFREFVSAHGQDALAGNAQYWLGETYYVRGQYEPAAQAFLQGYQGYPKSAKAPDSLLKLGMSLSAMKKNPEACAALGQLGKEFASAPPHVKDAATRERTKIGCK
ncbi:tol-pal system protein YbgF [Ferrovibrio terrae]|uniref:Cell division coordinator CpoB n=1 Tax=Ferrovibrio terrae TaxID=2594003 RepID=A0A516GX77_9PROT|nr:tol-pal system protein YbgF [Ferrovibrio terrae]QDO96116.1 tol-pal system protein YbgF [Ferrovibrio terrae]